MKDLTRFKNTHRGETCVVIGNGPSLDVTPLERLGEKYITFGSNKIYRRPFTPTYYSIIDADMAETCLPLPEDFKPEEMFIRAEYATGNPIYPVVLPGFSLNIAHFVVMGGTVTFALLQIAFYMGFETILLVGVDHTYPSAERFAGYKFVAGEIDPDHFTPADGKPYFDVGREFNAPELEGSAKAYAIAKELFEKDNRMIVNLTPGTKLDVFEKGRFEEWL